MISKIIQMTKDQQRPIRERTFILITLLSITGVFAVFVGDILVKDNPAEILVLGVTIFVVPTITFLSVHFHRVDIGAILIAMGTAFIILPATFFLGGGLYGGAIMWIVFGYLYIGLLLHGKKRGAMLGALTVLVLAEYGIAYYHPLTTYSHNKRVFFVDSMLSVIVVGLLIYMTVWFQNRLYEEENARAKAAAQEIEELNRAQSRFFSSMSHEIRTPINSILGLNEVILRDEGVSDKIAADAKNIEGAGKMLLSIINDILDMSKIESGRMDIVPVAYSFRGMISDIVNMIWARAQDKGLGFTVDVDPEIPAELYGDEVRIKQILINLLNNAVKYTAEGSVRLHIESEKKGDNAVLLTMAISDTGQGIKREALPELFVAFKRVDETKNRNIEGTGLGLSIVKQLLDLMGGQISVDSVYTQGSTFTVRLRQEIVSTEAVGKFDIAQIALGGERAKYRESFEAPDARILLVDDNELNLAVECELLEGTKIGIDTARSGAEALERTLEYRYDVIFLDHIMPQMDGVECLGRIRRQTGGLNAHTPIIVLTANAGSEEQELYRQSGFDDYLTKPVSGAQLESCLLKFLPDDLVFLNVESEHVKHNIFRAAQYTRRIPVAITTSSISDLPYGLAEELGIDIIPFNIHTEGGTFEDNRETVSAEVVRYIADRGKMARSEPPTVTAFEEFFAQELGRANHVVHIALGKGAGREYQRAYEAAQAFSNVSVVDSGALSSSVGMLVLAAYQMQQRGDQADRIVAQLEELKKRVRCSFVASTTEFMLNMGNITERVHRISETLLLRPGLRMKNGKLSIAHIYAGQRETAWMKYIAQTLPPNLQAEKDVLFVTYVGMEENDLKKIEAEIRRRSNFEHIIFCQASSTISLNVGPGAFGLLFFKSGWENYHIGRLIEDWQMSLQYSEEETGTEAATATATTAVTADMTGAYVSKEIPVSAPVVETVEVPEDFIILPGIDTAIGVKNCGSTDGYRTALRMFYEAAEGKYTELEDYYQAQDWENYTIRVHALKSSSRIIGVENLSAAAEALETAGKEGVIGYILENHANLMSMYAAATEILRPLFEEEETDEEDVRRPMADEALLSSAYDTIRDAVGELDVDVIEDALEEVGEYALPPEAAEIFDKVKKCLSEFDYEGILAALPQ